MTGEVKPFMAPGPWITRDLKLCVLYTDYEATVAENKKLREQLASELVYGPDRSTDEESALSACEAQLKEAKELLRAVYFRDGFGLMNEIDKFLGIEATIPDADKGAI